MKRKNAEEFVKIIQLLMSKDEESWILGITLFSETSFYKNLNKHTVFRLPAVYHTLGNLNASWDHRSGSMNIRLKSYIQELLEYPPKKTYSGNAPVSVGVIGTILFRLLWDEDSNRTRNSTIIKEVFYQSKFDIDHSTITKHKRNFRRRKDRKYTYDRELHYYEQALKTPILDYYNMKIYNLDNIYNNYSNK